jgi:hypothetical protein
MKRKERTKKQVESCHSAGATSSSDNKFVMELDKVEDIPFIPSQMFKYFDLGIVPPEEIERILHSSSTTSQMPSKVPLNKETSFFQSIALSSILESYLGDYRKPFLVFDHPGVDTLGQELTARGAGVRGLSVLASETYFILKMQPDNTLVIDWAVLAEVTEKYRGESVFGFGFTFIIWSIFIQQFQKKPSGTSLTPIDFKEFSIFHSGGWKKLKQESVSKQIFTNSLAQIFNANCGDVRDFYGMAEQGGVIFVDCEHGYKHVPNYALVNIIDPYTLEPVSIGETGLIQVISSLATSYYGQSILTEDVGVLEGIDDCPCGRKGERFTFHSRIEKAEIKGCGDTFRLSPVSRL